MSPLPDDDTTKKYCVSFDIAKSIAQNITQEIAQEFTKREPGVLPKHVQDLIHTIENEENAATIERMVVVRTPVEEYVGHLMQVLSIGKYRETIKESYYDKMFHLSLLINGRYILEKNEVIALRDGGPNMKIKKESEFMAIRMPSDGQLSYSQLLENTKQYMGDEAFSDYCPVTNNCQDFILSILQSNKCAYPHIVVFIKQDAESIFNKLPIHTKDVAKALTDVAAVGDKVVEDIKLRGSEKITEIKTAGNKIIDDAKAKHKEKCQSIIKSVKRDNDKKVAALESVLQSNKNVLGSLLHATQQPMVTSYMPNVKEEIKDD